MAYRKPDDPLTARGQATIEPRSVGLPNERVMGGLSIGRAVADIPAKLNGGSGIRVDNAGVAYTVSMDIGKLAPAPSESDFMTLWVPVYDDASNADNAVWRFPVQAIPADAPADDVIYGRQNHDWVDISSLVTVEWENVAGKPATYPPSAHTHPMSDVVALSGEISRIDGVNSAQDAAIAAIVAGTGTSGFAICSPTPPLATVPGQMWFETDTGIFYVWYDDGSGAQWVDVRWSSGGGGTADALPLAGGTMTGPIVLAADPAADMQAATMRYVDASIGSGMMGFFDYTFNSTNYVAPPIAGNFRMNNADQTLVTHVYLHETTAPGNDAALLLAQAISVGDKFLIQKKTDATKWRRYTVTAIADAGVYWDFTVTYVDGGAALDSARTAIIVQKAAPDTRVTTISTSAPSGGNNGDIWYQVT